MTQTDRPSDPPIQGPTAERKASDPGNVHPGTPDRYSLGGGLVGLFVWAIGALTLDLPTGFLVILPLAGREAGGLVHRRLHPEAYPETMHRGPARRFAAHLGLWGFVAACLALTIAFAAGASSELLIALTVITPLIVAAAFTFRDSREGRAAKPVG